MILNRAESLQNVPIPSMSLVDRDSVYKFLEHAREYCDQERVPFSNFLNLTIHELLVSLASDNASRLFLPKTDTAPFKPEMLFPFSAVRDYTQEKIPLKGNIVIAPVWNNMEVCKSVGRLVNEKKESDPGRTVSGIFIPEMKLAIVARDTELRFVEHTWGLGAALMYVVSVNAMDDVVGIEDDCWVYEDDGDPVMKPILERRFALAYEMELIRQGRKKDGLR